MTCIFCDLIANPSKYKNPEDEILEYSVNFYSKPALGHFIEGYTLIISKEHITNFAQLERNFLIELEEFKNFNKYRLQELFDTSIIVFEHGAYSDNYNAGCCIDHAHLHLLPINFDVHDILKQKYQFKKINQFTDLNKLEFRSYLSYIYYETTNGERFVFNINEKIPSQFLRRVICSNLNKPDIWDWALFPFREKIISFKNKYNNSYIIS